MAALKECSYAGSNRRPSAHKTDALTNWAKTGNSYNINSTITLEHFYTNITHCVKPPLHRVGFEPTRTNTADLKSAPLDLSGIDATYGPTLVFICISLYVLLYIHSFTITQWWNLSNTHTRKHSSETFKNFIEKKTKYQKGFLYYLSRDFIPNHLRRGSVHYMPGYQLDST